MSYYFIQDKIHQESDEHLKGEMKLVERKLKQGEDPDIFRKNIGDEIKIKEINSLTHRKPFFKSVKEKEEYEGNEESIKEEDDDFFEAQAIVFECATKDKNYLVTIIKAFDNDEELGNNISNAVTISAILMIIAIVLVNTFIYREMWAPFYFTLKELKNFNLSKKGNHQTTENKYRRI